MFTGTISGKTVWVKNQIVTKPANNQHPVFKDKKQVYHGNFYMGNNREHKYMWMGGPAILHHAALYCNDGGHFAQKT